MSRNEGGLGAALIRGIVRLYPQAVRAPYGDELREAALRRWSAARDTSFPAALSWWATEGVALLWGAVVERFERALGRGEIRRPVGERRPSLWDGLVTDVRWQLREMARKPAFPAALVALLTLVLGLATGVFALVDGVLMKPLRYADSDRLVAIWAARPQEGLQRVPLTQWDIQRVIGQPEIFEKVGGFTQQRSAMQLPDEVIEIGFGWLTTELHDVLSVQPILGRTFTVEERGELVVLLDHGFWQRRFGGDPDVLGQVIRIAQQPWTIVGVLPPNTPLELPSRGRVPRPTDVWSTMWVDGADPDASSAWIHTVARLAPGVSVQQARESLERIAEESRGLYSDREEAGFRLVVDELRDDFTAGISRQLWLLLAGTIVLFAAAITNVGSLMVLQLQRRRRRTAIRLAVGASTARLAADALIEAALLTGCAAALAVPLSRWVLTALMTGTPDDVPRLDMVALDARAMMFLAIAGVATFALLGGLSAWGTTRTRCDDVVRPGRVRARAWSGGRWVAAEVACAVPLLIVGVLLVRSADALSSIDPGFDAEGAVAVRLALPNHEISREELNGLLEEFHDGLRALPGVESVGASNLVPLAGGAFTGPVGSTVPELDEAGVLEADYRFITPGYLESVGVRLRGGELPRAGGSSNQVIVDETLARSLWPEGDPVGRTLAARPLGDRREDFTVVGVVSATRHETLREDGRPTVYFTSPGYTLPYVTTIVRGAVDPGSVFAPATALGAEVHPDLLVADARYLSEVVQSANALSLWLVTIVVALAVGAVSITVVGLYAVVGQFVSGYTPALGIRRALGAHPSHLALLVARRVGVIVVAGLVVGMMIAGFATVFIRSELVGVEPSDPTTWVLAVLALGLLVISAVAVPIRRAVSVSPLTALRPE